MLAVVQIMHEIFYVQTTATGGSHSANVGGGSHVPSTKMSY